MVIEFGRGVVRPMVLGLTLIGLSAMPGKAQTVPPCQTTAGEDGLVFEGTYTLIFAPVAFDTVRTDAPEIKIAPEARDGLGVLASGEKVTVGDAVVDFLTAGTVVHQCAVTVAVFDPKVHDLALLQAGDCGLKVVAGRPRLMAGHGQVVDIDEAPPTVLDAFGQPRSQIEVATSDPSIADMSALTDSRLYLLGQMPGLTSLLWMVAKADKTFAINLCPLTVADPVDVIDPKGPADAELCQDAEGKPIRLSVGQVTSMRFPGGKGVEIMESTIAAPAIAGFAFAEGGKSGTVEAHQPGTTSITLFGGESAVAAHCEIVVD
jgi:hypothetical protein